MLGRVQRIANFDHPGAVVVTAFGLLIAAGTVLLALPISHHTTTPVSAADAFFTAASAVTVTGLVVNDTGTVWSPFGEVVLVGLIQLGGLGIMTFAAFVGIFFNRRFGLRSGLLAGAEFGLDDIGVVRTLVRDVVLFVFGTEIVVAAILSGRFLVEDHSIPHALHLGVFHAVSAFNNAGFSILDGGLESHSTDWLINLVIAAAFIIGGIGFPVVFEVHRKWRTPHTWTLHTKVTLSTTVLLLAGGTVLLAVSEWTNTATIGTFRTSDKMLASFFQSATTRTAGFNTVPIGELRAASLMVFILLMVVGAGSASTGGGIKVSTVAVVVRATLSEFRRDSASNAFERRLPQHLQRQALALVSAALATVGTATFLLTLTHHDLALADLLVEAASAFGTVGVSTGVTADLSWIGRLLIIVLMFIGRVGPITFGTAVLIRSERRAYDYAEEDLLVG